MDNLGNQSMKGRYYVDFLNKDKGFTPDRIYFEGEKAYDNAKKWCLENLEKFDLDFIGYEEKLEDNKL